MVGRYHHGMRYGMRFMTLLLLGLLVSCAPTASRQGALPDVVTTPVTAKDELRVVVMGDQGTGSAVQLGVARAMQAVCQQNGCDLGIGLGDNFYRAGPKRPDSPLFKERFADLYGPLGIPFLMIPGNHDESWLVGGDGADPAGAEAQVAYSPLNPQWVMPARTYRAPVGDLAEFFALDTTSLASYLPSIRPNEWPGGPWDAAQRAWLAAHLHSSQARWKFVLGHHPLFSNGKHGDAGKYDGLMLPLQRGEGVRQLYGAACGQANFILSGHVHALELLPPQAECPGTWQLVSGAAGEAGGPAQGERTAAFGAFGQPGFVWMKVTKDAVQVRFYGWSGGQGQAHLLYQTVIAASATFSK